jgi:prevent-host-death family protein
MTIETVTVTEFKARCLDLIRRVEVGGGPVALTRRGRIVARLVGPPDAPGLEPPWLRLRGRGSLAVPAGHSVLDAADFDAAR